MPPPGKADANGVPEENTSGAGARQFSALEARLGHTFANAALLAEALTHPGIKSVEPDARDFQRLEFLGDAVLGLIFAESLYRNAGTAGEGRLTDARARLARGSNLAAVGRRLALGEHLRLAATSDAEKIRATDTAHEDALEAVFGAVFLDGGLDAARALAQRLFPDADDTDVEQSRSPKNRLQELLQKGGTALISQRLEYRVIAATGPDHAKQFTVQVWIDGVPGGTGAGPSKRAASEAAAVSALEKLGAGE